MRETTSSVVLAAIACLAVQSIFAQAPAYSDDEVKAQFLKAGTFRHAEFINGAYRRSFEMADCDTNRYARILREIVVEHTNETRRVIRSLGRYRTQQSLPFLYSYATNAQYGAYSLKSIFAIEGVTSNSVETLQRYLFFTNIVTSKTVYEKAAVCKEVLETLCESSVTSDLLDDATLVVRRYASNVSTGVSMIDTALVQADSTYRYSKRRLSDLRAAYPRSFNEYQTTYVTNAINELVAYPEENLPD